MCGIAGIIRWNEGVTSEQEIVAMTRAIAHRGPDGEGILVREGVALGHRRLAIIDVAGGRQPMCNEDESVWITFNGEIYNFQELRRELELRGHRFASHSDTEVLVHGYEEWGPTMVERLRGMFAFAIADFRNRKVFLARDHFGIKPLYYRIGEGYFAFASELSALRKVSDRPPRGRLDAIEYYLRYRYIPIPDTIYQGVHHLPPASHATIDCSGQMTGPTTYWNFQFQPREGVSGDEWLERFQTVVSESVQAHLVSDVPFGVFLSGGIDSTLVAHNMSELLERPVTAFCIGFEESSYSEVKYAETAARQMGVDLKTEILRADVAHLLPELVEHYGQPYADVSMIPTWYVSRLARQHVPMVLSGDGGDEGFGGYERYALLFHNELWGEALGLLSSPRGVLWRTPRIWNALMHPSSGRLNRWEAMFGFHLAQRQAIWKSAFQGTVNLTCPAFAAANEQAQKLRGEAYGQHLDYRTYLPGDILTKVDIASMCHGLEVRTPLVDIRVWELAAQVPSAIRCRAVGWGRKELKSLPKQSLRAKNYPSTFVDRRKMGFGIPEEQWIRKGTPVRALIDQLVCDPQSRLYEFFDHSTVQRYVSAVDAHLGGGGHLWAMLILALWLEQNQDVSFSLS